MRSSAKAKNRSELVATFLAVLELIRGGRVDVKENGDDVELLLTKNAVHGYDKERKTV